MSYLEKQKHMEPNMSKAFHQLAKTCYHEYKSKKHLMQGGSKSLDRSM